MKAVQCFLAFGLTLTALCASRAEEPDDSRIINHILQARNEIIRSIGATNSRPSPAFVAFWDFDGTILKGDCSEGLQADGKLVYPGLAQLAIEGGLSNLYSPDHGFTRFWTDYTNMEARIGP